VASDMEIIKKRVRVAMALGDCQEEIELEHEVEFPVKVRKIRSVCVSISEIETRPEEGTVCVEGKLCKRFSWVADCDGEYNGVNYEAGGIYDLPIEERFTHYLALKDLLPSADAQAQVRIKKVGEPTKCLSGDDVPDIWKQSVVLETYVTADMPVEAEIVTDIYASGKDLKITKATCGIEDLKGQCEKEINVEVTVTNSNDVQQATQSIVGQCDAIYIPTDNVFSSAMPVVHGVTSQSKTPVICGETGMAKEGGLATLGTSYYELGYQTGIMAAKVLNGEAEPATMPIESAKKFDYYINGAVAEEFGITIPSDLEQYVE
jgi:hypothetical protein